MEIERSSSCAQSGDREKGPTVVHNLEMERKVQQLCTIWRYKVGSSVASREIFKGYLVVGAKMGLPPILDVITVYMKCVPNLCFVIFLVSAF